MQGSSSTRNRNTVDFKAAGTRANRLQATNIKQKVGFSLDDSEESSVNEDTNAMQTTLAFTSGFISPKN